MNNLNQPNQELSVKIPKDLEKMRVKVGAFTKRQWAYLVIAGVLGFIAYHATVSLLGTTGSVWITMLVIVPFAIIAFKHKDGMSMEQILLLRIRYILFPSNRKYKGRFLGSIKEQQKGGIT